MFKRIIREEWHACIWHNTQSSRSKSTWKKRRRKKKYRKEKRKKEEEENEIGARWDKALYAVSLSFIFFLFSLFPLIFLVFFIIFHFFFFLIFYFFFLRTIESFNSRFLNGESNRVNDPFIPCDFHLIRYSWMDIVEWIGEKDGRETGSTTGEQTNDGREISRGITGERIELLFTKKLKRRKIRTER